MTFRFRFGPLLRYRAWQEDRCAIALADARRRQEALAARLALLTRDLRAWRAALEASAGRGATGEELHAAAIAVEALRQRAAAASDELATVDSLVEEERAALAAASRARQAVARLEDTARAAYRRRREGHDQAELDDVASRYVAWRRMSAP